MTEEEILKLAKDNFCMQINDSFIVAAIRSEREACALIADKYSDDESPYTPEKIALEIRERINITLYRS